MCDVLFWEQVDAQGDCWWLQAERRWSVANTSIQHNMRIYSEYEPGNIKSQQEIREYILEDDQLTCLCFRVGEPQYVHNVRFVSSSHLSSVWILPVPILPLLQLRPSSSSLTHPNLPPPVLASVHQNTQHDLLELYFLAFLMFFVRLIIILA